MTDNFIPIVSNTPPPIDDIDDEDDFTDFNAATNKWDSDDEFGSISFQSGPPPMSDDSLGSPCKKVGSLFTEPKNKKIEESYFTPIKNDISSSIQCNGGILNEISEKENNDWGFNGFSDEHKQPQNEFINPVTDWKVDENNADNKENTNDAGSDDFVPSPSPEETGANRFNSTDNCLTKEDIQSDGSTDLPAVDVGEVRDSTDVREVATNVDAITSEPAHSVDENHDKSVLTDSNADAHFAAFECFNDDNKNKTPQTETTNDVSSPLDGAYDPVQENVRDKDFDSFDNDDYEDAIDIATNNITEIVAKSEEILKTPQDVEDRTSNNENIDSGEDDFAKFDAFRTEPHDKLHDNNDSSNQEISNHRQDEDFAAFTEFESSSVISKSDNIEAARDGAADNEVQMNAKLSSEAPLDESCDDNDFADFAGFDVEPTTTGNNNKNKSFENNDLFPPETSTSSNSDNFAAFENNDNFPAFPQEEDDFGDFGSASNEVGFIQVATKKPSSSERIINILRWFPHTLPSSDDTTYDIDPVHRHVEDDILSLFQTSQSPSNPTSMTSNKSIKRPSEMWDLLEDIDNTTALKFQWNGSNNHQQLLRALGIKTQNILFSGTSAPYYIPTYYAAGLGLLEPDKEAKPMSAADKITATSPTDVAPSSNEMWTAETDRSVEVNACDIGDGGVANSIAPSSVLDSSSFNLDMFDVSSKSSNPSPAQDKLDPELLEFAMNVTPDATQMKKADPLSKILASLKVSSAKKPPEEEELSEDAAKIITKLPDLSYMRSKVLLFPLGKSTTMSN